MRGIAAMVSVGGRYRSGVTVALLLMAAALGGMGCDTLNPTVTPTYTPTMILDRADRDGQALRVQLVDERLDRELIGDYTQEEMILLPLHKSNYTFSFSKLEEGLRSALKEAGYAYDEASPTTLAVHLRRANLDVKAIKDGQGKCITHYLFEFDVYVLHGETVLNTVAVGGDHWGRYIYLALGFPSQGTVEVRFFKPEEKSLIEKDYGIAMSIAIENALNDPKVVAAFLRSKELIESGESLETIEEPGTTEAGSAPATDAVPAKKKRNRLAPIIP